MSNFARYATYYDSIYAGKNYRAESEYIDKIIACHAPASKKSTLLDVGCGTGHHARHLAELGYQVTGIDRSPEMIALAVKRGGARFVIADAAGFKSPGQFSTVVSLFHVLSYHTLDDQLDAACRAAYDNLCPGGLFIFDFWYGPAVLHSTPVERAIRIETPEKIIHRTTRPTLREMDNCVDIEFELNVVDRRDGAAEQFKEMHPIRYFFLPELHRILGPLGFRVVSVRKWMELDRPPSINDRDALLVAQK